MSGWCQYCHGQSVSKAKNLDVRRPRDEPATLDIYELVTESFELNLILFKLIFIDLQGLIC